MQSRQMYSNEFGHFIPKSSIFPNFLACLLYDLSRFAKSQMRLGDSNVHKWTPSPVNPTGHYTGIYQFQLVWIVHTNTYYVFLLVVWQFSKRISIPVIRVNFKLHPNWWEKALSSGVSAPSWHIQTRTGYLRQKCVIIWRVCVSVSFISESQQFTHIFVGAKFIQT